MKKSFIVFLLCVVSFLLTGCLETVSWSPDGNWIAYVSRRSGNPQLWISNVKGTQHIKLTTLSKDEAPFFPVWMPSGDNILFVQADARNNKYSMMLLDTNKKTQQTLVRFDESNSFDFALTTDAVFFAKHNKVYALNIETGAKSEIFKKAGYSPYVYAVSSSGKYLLAGTFSGKANPDMFADPDTLHILGTKTGAAIDIPRNSGEEFLVKDFVSEEDKLFYIVKNQSSGKPSYKGVVLDVETGNKTEALIPLEVDSAATVWMGNSTLRFLKNNLVMDLNVEDGSVRVVKEIHPEESWEPASFSPDGKKLAFLYPLTRDTGKDLFELSSRYMLVVVYDIFSDHVVFLKDKAENDFLYCKALHDGGSTQKANHCLKTFHKKYPHLSKILNSLDF